MNNIIEDFCVAWQMLDAELIIKHSAIFVASIDY